MRILEDLRNPVFWNKVIQLTIVFFVIFVGLTLLISHFGDIFSGNFAAIYEEEWSNGKWVSYFLIRLAISLVYAIYMTSRRSHSHRRK